MYGMNRRNNYNTQEEKIKQIRQLVRELKVYESSSVLSREEETECTIKELLLWNIVKTL
jgi:hypothetical protein